MGLCPQCECFMSLNTYNNPMKSLSFSFQDEQTMGKKDQVILQSHTTSLWQMQKLTQSLFYSKALSIIMPPNDMSLS